MSVEIAVAISILILGLLGSATWFFPPKFGYDANEKTLARSVLIEKQITMELEFHDRFNNIYSPPTSSAETGTQMNIYAQDVRLLAKGYVEERERVLSARDKLRNISNSIQRSIRFQQIHFITFLVIVVVSLIVHSEGTYLWWINAIGWITPFPILYFLKMHQQRLFGKYEE